MARAEETIRSRFEELKLFAYPVANDVKSPSIGIYGVAKLLSSHCQDILHLFSVSDDSSGIGPQKIFGKFRWEEKGEKSRRELPK